MLPLMIPETLGLTSITWCLVVGVPLPTESTILTSELDPTLVDLQPAISHAWDVTNATYSSGSQITLSWWLGFLPGKKTNQSEKNLDPNFTYANICAHILFLVCYHRGIIQAPIQSRTCPKGTSSHLPHLSNGSAAATLLSFCIICFSVSIGSFSTVYQHAVIDPAFKIQTNLLLTHFLKEIAPHCFLWQKIFQD